MSEYDIPVKKGLRLKAVQPKNGKVQKAKQSKKSKNQAALTNKPEKAESKLQMTVAEANFEKHRRKKLEKMLETGLQSYGDKKKEYNKYLESLTDHNDMPKIGPG